MGVPAVTVRHLAIAFPDTQPARLVLMHDTGEELATLQCERSFRRIQRHGVWFRLAGRDRATGEMVYLPETA